MKNDIKKYGFIYTKETAFAVRYLHMISIETQHHLKNINVILTYLT